MHVVVTCTQCSRQLRLPQDIIGSTVRCPLCHAIFATRGTGDGKAEALPVDAPKPLPPPPAGVPPSVVPPSGISAGGAAVTVKGASLFFDEMPLTTITPAPVTVAGRGASFSRSALPPTSGKVRAATRVASAVRVSACVVLPKSYA